MRRAFSIIELLVVIGVIGLLLGLAIPAFRLARSSVSARASLANLRAIGQTFELHLGSNGDRYVYPQDWDGSPPYGPYIIEPRVYEPTGSADEVTYTFAGAVPWFCERMWPLFVQDVAPWEEHYATWLSPGHGALSAEQELWEAAPFVSYRYSNSFLAQPRLWSGSASADESLLGAVLSSQVAHPSGKVLAFDVDLAYRKSADDDARRPLLFADGHADLRLDDDAVRGVANPLNNQIDWIYHNTPDGVAGLDF